MQHLPDEPLVSRVLLKLHEGSFTLFNFSEQHEILFPADPAQSTDQDFEMLQQQWQVFDAVWILKIRLSGLPYSSAAFRMMR